MSCVRFSKHTDKNRGHQPFDPESFFMGQMWGNQFATLLKIKLKITRINQFSMVISIDLLKFDTIQLFVLFSKRPAGYSGDL